MGFNHSNLHKSEPQSSAVQIQKPIAKASFCQFSRIQIHDIGDPIDTFGSIEEIKQERNIKNFEIEADQEQQSNLMTQQMSKRGILKNGNNQISSGIFNEEAKVVRFSDSNSIPSKGKRISMKKRRSKILDMKYQALKNLYGSKQ